MKAWIERNRRNVRVHTWLKANPPPEDWQETALAWAFTEMTFAPR